MKRIRARITLRTALFAGALFLIVAAITGPARQRARENARMPRMQEALSVGHRDVGGPVALWKAPTPASAPRLAARPAATARVVDDFQRHRGYVASDSETPADITESAPNLAAAAPAGPGAAQAAPLPTPAAFGRKVIMTADVTLEVKEFQKVHDGVVDVARKMGGYVGTSQLNLPRQGAQESTITIRVPHERYDDAVAQIRKLGKVLVVSQSAEDVTQKYVDLQARLRNLKADEERVLEIMKRAHTIRETLTVDERLSELRGNIEAMEGEFRYLSFQVAMATITVTLAAPAQAAPPAPEPPKWSFVKELKGAWGDALGLAQAVASIVAYLLAYLLFWAPAALIAWLLWRRCRPAAKPAPAPLPLPEPAPENGERELAAR